MNYLYRLIAFVYTLAIVSLTTEIMHSRNLTVSIPGNI